MLAAVKRTLVIAAATLSIFCMPDTVAISVSLSHASPARKVLLALFADERTEDQRNQGAGTRD